MQENENEKEIMAALRNNVATLFPITCVGWLQLVATGALNSRPFTTWLPLQVCIHRELKL